ncbi:MAG: NAD+ synthase, partial [Thermodesulfobacteria bacterium]|nr:NAD+ synthase [Thermodesulfobacteriota bacterium]
MKLALAQINPTVGDLEGNARKIETFANQAREAGASLVVFPELSLCGYPPRDLFYRRDFLEEMEDTYRRLKEKISGIAVILGFAATHPQHEGLPWQNVAVCFKNGQELVRYAKNLLPSYDIYDEPRYFAPLGRVTLFEFENRPWGLTICEDIWNLPGFVSFRYHFDPIALLAEQGVRVIVNISASPFHLGKGKLRQDLLSTQARRTKAHILYCNQVGANDHLIFDGHSLVFSPEGELLAEARDFEEDLLLVDLEEGRGERHPVSTRREESLLKALVLGVRDYFRKTGFRGALVGLS